MVRPAAPIPFDVEDFTSADIERMIDQGKADAIREVKAAQADPGHIGHEVARDLRL